jgi:hypothetical protein
MVEGLDPAYWRSLRERLERELSQEEIVIRAHAISGCDMRLMEVPGVEPS